MNLSEETKSAIQKLFERHFNSTYSDELLSELGYRVNYTNGTISKMYEDSYWFDGNFFDNECYTEQAMEHILQSKLGMDYGTELEKFL